MTGNTEKELIAEAATLLGDGEDVLAAGHFGLADLARAQVLGGTVGAVADPAADPLAQAVAAGAGGFTAVRLAAEEAGVTVKLVVVVTPTRIHVLNRDTDGRLATRVASFERDTVDIRVEKLGASRYLTLTDEAGEELRLHGSVGFLSAQAPGDKAVLDLLAADA
ncbi:hypothetical protein AB0N73_15960 [Microbacterium sp. NPDC089189]|uniref:hypothetical protein n=1 Tax=Microbacterium sp. NPDC089189 TaxID=3154972 RepID=UPI00342320AB